MNITEVARLLLGLRAAGWSEKKIVNVFSAATVVFAAIAVVIAYFGIVMI